MSRTEWASGWRERSLCTISKMENILTDGVAFGSIQVPTNGQVIIMMADRQTTGGYTKIGTVISVDLPKLAQAPAWLQGTFCESRHSACPGAVSAAAERTEEPGEMSGTEELRNLAAQVRRHIEGEMKHETGKDHSPAPRSGQIRRGQNLRYRTETSASPSKKTAAQAESGQAAPAVSGRQAEPEEKEEEVSIQEGTIIRSPLVGIFHASDSQSGEPFVDCGKRGRTGTGDGKLSRQ